MSLPSPSSPPAVVTLGAGFGGIYAARRLDALLKRGAPTANVVLIDRHNYSLMTPAGRGRHPVPAAGAARHAPGQGAGRERPRHVARRAARPVVYETKGTLAALGHATGVGRIGRLKVYGFLAWWLWRSFYLLQMPRWNRRARIAFDWTISLFFKNDIVELDVQPDPRPSPRRPMSVPVPAAPSAAAPQAVAAT